MFLDIPPARIYVHTGTAPWQPERPTALLVHGVLCDHSVWQPLLPGLNAAGWNVAAIDLPGHGHSSGPVPASVQQAAEWIAPVLDALQLSQVALIGHSWGSLIALQAAAALGARVSHLGLIGTASPMRVAPALLGLARTDPPQAIALIGQYSRSSHTPADFDGTALGHQVLASNPDAQLLHTGLAACNDYQGAQAAMQRVTAPTLFIQGQEDRMTPSKASAELITTAQQRAGAVTEVVALPCGHQYMVDAPQALLQALTTGLLRC